MATVQPYKLRAELRKLGVPTKSIKVLRVINANPGLTTTAVGEMLGMTKQAASLHLRPLEALGVVGNSHKHPLYKAWDITQPRVKEIITLLS